MGGISHISVRDAHLQVLCVVIGFIFSYFKPSHITENELGIVLGFIYHILKHHITEDGLGQRSLSVVRHSLISTEILNESPIRYKSMLA